MRTGWCGDIRVHERHKHEIRPTVERLCPGLTNEQADGMRVCDVPLAHIGHYPDSGDGQGLWCPGRDTDLPGAQEQRREYLRGQAVNGQATQATGLMGNGDQVTLHGMVLRTDPGSCTVRLEGGEVIVLPAGTPMEVAPRKSPAQRAYEARNQGLAGILRVPWDHLEPSEQADWEQVAQAARDGL